MKPSKKGKQIMSIIIKQIEIIERIDQLIRLQATGTPSQLARRLEISKTKLHRTITIMRELHAPIVFDLTIQSYVYEEEVGFEFGFYKGRQRSRLNPFVG
ncbi:hypothetical protein U6A24_02090 [Aquimarina gracilis]|uniref:HTH domain-containing protein n=1 Tax=Aquimarina gracilis TaxID=874422 RepID=A0ABU5ZQN2_9FLAO|nr:hypothetical protein [Aquimarina gracilis]MEB3344228.1 hypothetical protein [Aquimarina gracilis]